MRFLKLALFAAAIVAMVEISYRVYLYGPAALLPQRMDSYTQIFDSGLVQAGTEPGVLYELRPGLDTWYKGVRFHTNSAGLRDDEYTVAKPDGAFRIAVLGSSWTMGSGVASEDTWHARIEEWLNAEDASRRYEVLNFGVDQYGIGEIVATLEHKALAYEPDLIIVALTYFTPAVKWPDPDEAFVPRPRRHPFLDSHALRFLDHRFGLGIYDPIELDRERVETVEQSVNQMETAAALLERVSKERGIPVAVVKLAYRQGWQQSDAAPGPSPLENSPALTYLDVTSQVADSGVPKERMRVSVWDSHPNRLGHELMGRAILDGLRARQLLPE